MKIRTYDCPTRFFVTSSKPDVENLVDLLALKGNGECSCEDFRMVKLMNLRRKEGPTQCKHIKAVREHFLNQIISYIREDSGMTK